MFFESSFLCFLNHILLFKSKNDATTFNLINLFKFNTLAVLLTFTFKISEMRYFSFMKSAPTINMKNVHGEGTIRRVDSTHD